MGISIKLQFQNILLLDAYLQICQIDIRKVQSFYTIKIYYNLYINEYSFEQQQIPLFNKNYCFSIDEIPKDIESYCYTKLSQLYK